MSPFKADTSKSVPDFLPNQIDINIFNTILVPRTFIMFYTNYLTRRKLP